MTIHFALHYKITFWQGLLWGLAVITKAFGDTNPKNLSSLNSQDPVQDLMLLGALSLALTFINIVCIFLTGIFVLKVSFVLI